MTWPRTKRRAARRLQRAVEVASPDGGRADVAAHRRAVRLAQCDGEQPRLDRRLAPSRGGAATGEQALRQQLVVRGTSLPVFFAADPKLKLPKGVKPGEVLTGTVTYCKASSSVAGPDKHPDGFPISPERGRQPGLCRIAPSRPVQRNSGSPNAAC